MNCPHCKAKLDAAQISAEICTSCGKSFDASQLDQGKTIDFDAGAKTVQFDDESRTVNLPNTVEDEAVSKAKDLDKTVDLSTGDKTIDFDQLGETVANDDVGKTVDGTTDDNTDFDLAPGLGETVADGTESEDVNKTIDFVSGDKTVDFDSHPGLGGTVGDEDIGQSDEIDKTVDFANSDKTVGFELSPELNNDNAAPEQQEQNKGGEDESTPDADESPEEDDGTLRIGTVDVGDALKDTPAATAVEQATGEEEDPRTVDKQADDATLETGTLPEFPVAAQDGTEQSIVDATVDSAQLSEEEVNNLQQLWSGTYQAADTPQTSLKANVRTVASESNLVIQPREMRDKQKEPNATGDYELIKQLGVGGMGVVYAARQASIDRTVAVKMIKAEKAKDASQRDKFLLEAVVTGELEHPNIVPIYDLGANNEGALFYAMKRVKGTPWEDVVYKNSFAENLEILMKVADAVGFAHSRDVVHRDLKPENVMLGDFGEVLVMDWGMAMNTASKKSSGMGGTPAYMAPEMAAGPLDRIGKHSDIYLLGAILFEIITGKRPHSGANIMKCLFAASKNIIQPAKETGELMDIAYKAMSTYPKDRYRTVGDFQDAIREYQSHSESVALATRAADDLEDAQKSNDYQTYAKALFGFQEAYDLWDGNSKARKGVSRVSLAYAEAALNKGDYDLGASLLDQDDPDHKKLYVRIKEADQEREARQTRLRAAKRMGMALVAMIFLIVTVAFFWIRSEAEKARAAEQVAKQEKEEADRQRGIAEEKTDEAIAQRKIAEEQRQEAETQRQEADRQRASAEIARADAEEAREKEEYGAYIARIGLAAAKIDENAFDHARTLLDECPEHLRHWEWGRLMHLCNQDVRSLAADGPLDCASYSPNGELAAAGGWDGKLRIWQVESGEVEHTIATGAQYVFAVAFSPDGRHAAAGTNGAPDYVRVYDVKSGEMVSSLKGHGDAVISVVYSRDGRQLLTSSYDGTARLTYIDSGDAKAFVGHDWWVWSARFNPDESKIVTASQDGSVMVWSVQTTQASPPFTGHQAPVFSAGFSPDGKHVVSGGRDNKVLVWEPDKVKDFDFSTLVSNRVNPPPPFTALTGHSASVRSVEVSSDGRTILSGAHDNTVRIWDFETGTALKTLRGHAGRVRSCRFSPDASRVLSASHDGRAKIWDIAGYRESQVFQGHVMRGHSDAILSASFSPDGKQIVTASRDRTAKAWNVDTGKELREYREGHTFLASRAIFFPDARRILTAALDNTARIWDVETGGQTRELHGTGATAAVALSKDGKWILTGSDDKTTKLWNSETGQIAQTLVGHAAEISCVAISQDGSTLFSGDVSGTGRIWSAETGKEIHRLDGHSRRIIAAQFTPDGSRVLTASADNTVGHWNVETGKEHGDRVLKHPTSVTSLAISSDGARALTACGDNIVRLWEIDSTQIIREIPMGDSRVGSVAFSPDNGQAALVCDNKSVKLWDLKDPQSTGRQFATPDATAIWSATYSPDGKYILTVGGNDAQMWNVSDGARVMTFSPHGSIASASYSPDGSRVITGSWDKTARIWNAESGVSEAKLQGHTQYINSAVFSADGTKVLTASDDRTALLWDAKSNEILRRFEGHTDRVHSGILSHDGTRVLTASADHTARIWDVANGKELVKLSGHDWSVLNAAFSADSTRVITASEDNTARIWDAESGDVLFTLAGHSASVTSVAFSPDGTRALTGSQDNTARLWDALTGEEIMTLKGHTEEVTSVSFSPDGDHALTSSQDGTAILWMATEWRTAE